MTSYFQVRLAFHHHTLVILAFCDKHRFSPSNTLDRFFSLPRHRSPGFGTNTGSKSENTRPNTAFYSVLTVVSLMIHAYISTIETKLPVLTGWSLIPKVRGANRIDSWPLLLVSCLASRFHMQPNLDEPIINKGNFDAVSRQIDTSNLNFPSRYSFTIVLNRFQAFNEAGFPTIPNKVGTFERQFGFSGDTYE